MNISKKVVLMILFLVISCVPNDGLNYGQFEKLEEKQIKDLLDSSANLIKQELFKEAEVILDTARSLAMKAANDSLLAITNNNLGSLNYWIGNYNKSIFHYERALEIDREHNDSTGLVIRLKNIGISYWQKGDFETSTQYYLDALTIVKYTNQNSEQASINNSIGNVLNDLERFERGYQHLLVAERMWREEGDSLRISYALGNQGNSLLGLERVEEAIKLHQRALEIKKRVAGKSSISITYNNLGEAYYKLGEYDLAKDYFIKSLELRSELSEVKGIAIVAHNLAEIAISLENFNQALEFLLRAEKIAKNESLKDVQIENLRLQKSLYAKKGDYKKAFEIDARFDELKEKDFNEQVVKVQELELEQEEIAKEAYKSQYELSEEVRTRQKFQSQIQQIVIIAAIIAIIIVGYFAYTLRNKNRHIENLIRELHHRVKNHLGMISGMFGAQTGLSMTDTAVLDEAKTRVEAVNGIHRRLYRQDEYEYVNMKEYFEELVDNNALVFGLFNKIEKHFEIHEQIMDIDKAISVGLIANEVLTNAFKYGLQDTPEPKLKIVLEKAIKGYKMIIFNNAESDNSTGGGFGGELISRLAQNLKGQIQVIKQGGFQFELTFP